MARVIRRASTPVVRKRPAAAAPAPVRTRVRKTQEESVKDSVAATQRILNMVEQLTKVEWEIAERQTMVATKLEEIKALYTDTYGEEIGLKEFGGMMFGYNETKSKTQTEYPQEKVLELLEEMYDDEAEGLRKLLSISTTPAKELKLLFGENKLASIAKEIPAKVTGKEFIRKAAKKKK